MGAPAAAAGEKASLALALPEEQPERAQPQAVGPQGAGSQWEQDQLALPRQKPAPAAGPLPVLATARRPRALPQCRRFPTQLLRQRRKRSGCWSSRHTPPYLLNVARVG